MRELVKRLLLLLVLLVALVNYNVRNRTLQIKGKKSIRFDVEYIGADDTYGPNYTGQDSVRSCYRLVHHK